VKTTSEALILHLLVRSFCSNSAALYVGSVRRLERGFEVQIRFLTSKAMILFTCRLMPADLRLQSNRETQKSEIYFTNYTLTGKKTLSRRRVWTLQGDSAGRVVSNAFVRRVLANFISPITL
jgi:hypothetical protein